MGSTYAKRQETGDRKPSVEVRLPFPVRYLEPIMNQLILRLDIAEERETRIEDKLDKLLTALEVPNDDVQM